MTLVAIRPHGMVLMIAWAAGCVDAISYIGLGHVFTANMTGNTVLLGLALGQVEGLASLRSVIALGAFALGVALGVVTLGEGSAQGRWPKAVTRAIVVECALLGLFALGRLLTPADSGGGLAYGLIALAAAAMGIQSAAMRHLNLPGVATTYITGTMTGIVAGLIRHSRPNGPDRPTARCDPDQAPSAPRAGRLTDLGLQAAVFAIYAVGALSIGVVEPRWPSVSAVLPFAAVGIVVANARLRYRET